MGSNLCEYIQDRINIQYLIRQLLRMANDQTDCSAEDCMDDNINNSIDNNLQQVDHGIGSTTLTFGYLLFAFLFIWMILPPLDNNIPLQPRQQPTNRNQQSTKFSENNHHDDDDHNDPGFTT